MSNFAAQSYNPYAYNRNQITAYPYPSVVNPYATVQPTYTQPYANQQSQMIPGGLRGRTVSTPEEITPQEVPMDGGYSFFPLSDGSAVYMKAWSQDGKINTYKFIPESIEIPVDNNVDLTTQILTRLENIENSIDKLTKYRNNRNNQKNKQDQEENHE